MSGSFLSPSWYRVASLRPSLRRQALIHRHVYRGLVWFVLQDRASGRSQRLSPSAYEIVGLMDGVRSTQEIWDAACTRLGDDAPTQDETIRVLGLLHSADVLRCDVSPDVEELLRRRLRRDRREWWQRLGSPLGVKIPLWDPDAFLSRWLPLVRPCFSRAGAIVSVALVAGALTLFAVNAPEIFEAGASSLLSPRNLLLLWLAYPIVKGLHELGHAFATKAFGGEVHEVGIMLLVFVPVPYVDASAASVMPERHRRMLVGAVGIWVELVIAAFALALWLLVEPGWVRSLSYTVMWMSGASTLLFNGNPLLRFDGYYVLADAIEIPNLRMRSNQYLGWLVLRRVFGLENVRDPVSAPGEAAWFFAYGVSSYIYRLVVLFAIAVFVSQHFFVVGVVLAGVVTWTGLVYPILQQIKFLLTSGRLGRQRPRALAISGAALSLALALLFVAPTPVFTVAQGVVWPPEGSQVRARADGFVVEVLVAPGAQVEPGQPLVRTRFNAREAEVSILAARLQELELRYYAERRSDRGSARKLETEAASARVALARAQERTLLGVLRSPRAGRFVLPDAGDLPGRFIRQGEPIGWVVGDLLQTVRAVVPQADVALVRDRTRRVQVRIAGQLARTLESQVQREVPAASDRLPSAALGARGGGPFAVDATDASGLQTEERVFHFDLALPAIAGAREIGTRVHVRFDHGWEPLAARLGRSIRRLFLRVASA